MRAWPAAALAAVLSVIFWSQPRAGDGRGSTVDPGAGAAAAALHRATGIDPAAPVWGAPFREMAALYDGADPPLEALGVSAKFSNGKAATARYHTMLELPGSGGHLPRDAQRRAAARTAAALKAPPLVDAWLRPLIHI